MRTPLRVLDEVRVDEPCAVPWGSMRGDDTARHCDRCDKQVVNLSRLTAADAAAVLAGHREGLCVRFRRRRDGTVVTAADRAGPAGRPRWRVAVWAASLLASMMNVGCSWVTGERYCARCLDEEQRESGESSTSRSPAQPLFPSNAGGTTP